MLKVTHRNVPSIFGEIYKEMERNNYNLHDSNEFCTPLVKIVLNGLERLLCLDPKIWKQYHHIFKQIGSY